MTEPQGDVAGDERTTKSKVLEAGAGMTQDFTPVKSICAHLNAFHVYADDPKRFVEANHYCSHLTEDVRQCILYDSPNPGARLIGIEYMITPKLYATLDTQERRLWHSHIFEVKSGMLIMPQPSALVPQAAWEQGEPKLMTSFTSLEQMPEFEKVVGERDSRFGAADWRRKKEIREYIREPEIHPDADATWK
ncbi:hypothetical protein F5883DRAFT_454118 [Diaporthe sp. PMI_573]|nr:hypothetical protein F5883DRAFT_454118 [Diaporthaceae sp. PMI_573]